MDRGQERKREKRERMNKMVKDGFVPNVEHPVAFDCRSKRVRAKGAQGDSEKAKSSCDAEKQYGCHFLELGN